MTRYRFEIDGTPQGKPNTLKPAPSLPGRYRVVRPTPAVDPTAITKRVFSGPLPWAEKFRWNYGRLDMATIQQILYLADYGVMTPITDLSREALALDPHNNSLAQKRFGAVSALDVGIVAAKHDDLDPKVAEEIAADVRAMVSAIRGRQGAVYDLAWSLYDGRGALEIDWDWQPRRRFPYQPRALEWVHPRRLAYGPDRELRVIDTFTAGRGWWTKHGEALHDFPGKFITWEPRYFNDYPEREGLARRSFYWQLFKRFSARMRMVLTELFAIPWRVITFPQTTEFHETSYEDMDDAEERAEGLGGDNTVAMPPGASLDIKWPGENSGQLFEMTRTGVNEELSKLWLGNVGTTDDLKTGLGSNVASVHKEEQNIFLQRDAFGIAERFKECLVDVYIVLNYGADWLPYSPDVTLEAETLEDRNAEQTARDTAISLSVPVALSDYYDKSKIRQPGKDEPVILGVTDSAGNTSTKIIYPDTWDGPRYDNKPDGGPPGSFGAPPAQAPPTAPAPPAAPGAPSPPNAPRAPEAPKAPAAPAAAKTTPPAQTEKPVPPPAPKTPPKMDRGEVRTLTAAGKGPVNWTAVRRQATKPLDIKKGKELAAAAKDARDAAKAAKAAPAPEAPKEEPKEPANQAPEETHEPAPKEPSAPEHEAPKEPEGHGGETKEPEEGPG